MKYVLVGIAFGLIWALIQYSRSTVTDPAALAGPIILFGLFGAMLWGLRTWILRHRKNRK